MPNDNNKLTTTINNASVPAKQGLKIGLKSGLTGTNVPTSLRDRVAKASQVKTERREAETINIATMKNRLGLMLDISGSMGYADGIYGTRTDSKIVLLQRAYTKFIESVSFADTAIAVQTFPFTNVSEYEREVVLYGGGTGVSLPLTTNPLTLAACLMAMVPSGGTPLAEAMHHVINNVPVTRGIIISDGDADNPGRALDQARTFKEADIPVDCVHIGTSQGGEHLLQQIAELTGGIYIKFTDVEQFAKSLVYLTPKYRAMLTSGAVSALDIGASSIKYLGGSK